jgi:hypothetical protein
MRRKFTAMSVSTLVVLALAGSSASVAAASSGLVLTESGTPAANGAVMRSLLGIGGCRQASESGTLAKNGKATDKATFTGELTHDGNCGTESLTGIVSAGSFSASGVASLKADLNYTETGECVYTVKKLTVDFEVPGRLVGEGEVVGKLNKTASTGGKSCAKTATLPFVAAFVNHEGELFGTET